MYEVTKKNCYKCDLETISTNDSQYFWINLKDFEAETERNWQNIFNKYGDSSTLKYRKELITNAQFQPNRIFVRNDFFERIIKSYKATNAEFVMLKKKLGICPYEVIDEEDFILMPEAQDNIREPTKEPTKESTKESSEETSEETTKESTKESSKEPTKKPTKESTKESSEEPIISDEKSMEIKNTTGWYDKNKFNKILSIVDSNKFNHRSKISVFKFLLINKLIDNIKNNTID